MINTKEYIENFLKNPHTDQMNQIIPACKRLIDFSDKNEIKTISKTIEKVYHLLLQQLSTNIEIHQQFGDFYIRLAEMSEEKDKMKCLEKAKMIFNTLIILNKSTLDDETNLKFDKICKDLTILTSNTGKNSPKRYQGTIQKTFSIDAFRFNRKEKLSSQRLIENNIGKKMLLSDFNDRILIIEEAISEFHERIKQSNLCEDLSEETRIAQTAIPLADKTHKCLSGIKKIIISNEIDKTSALEAIKVFRMLNSTFEIVIKKIEQTSSSQDMKLFHEKIKKTSNGLYKLTHATDLGLEKFSETHVSKEKILSLDILEEINAEYLDLDKSLSSLLKNRANKIRIEESHFSSLFFLLSNFFQFTEENYFQLFYDKENEKKLVAIITQAEKIYEPQSTLLDKHSVILATYINMLAQKHPSIIEEEKIQENDQKVRSNCIRYNCIHKEDVPNAKKIDAILKFNSNDRKVKIDLTHTNILKPNNFKIKSDLISIKNAKNFNEGGEKFKDIIQKIIHSHQERNLDIMALLEESRKKIQKESLVNLINPIIKLFKEISTFDTQKHNLKPLDLLKISYKVEEGFFFNSFTGPKYKNLVLLEEDKFFNRSLLVDTKTKSFTLISRLYGDLKEKISEDNEGVFDYIKGGVKQISAAASFFREEDKLVFKETIAAEPLPGTFIESKSIGYLFQFGEKRGLMGAHYYMEYPKMDQESEIGLFAQNQLIIQDRADEGDFNHYLTTHNLSDFNTWKIIFNMLEDVSHGVNYLHSLGIVHWDLKLANILCSQDTARINDYDTIFWAGKGEQPPSCYPGYGAIVYRAPESNVKGGSEKITEEEAKRRDMYGLGCMFMDIFNFGKEEKKWSSIYEKVAGGEINEENLGALMHLIKRVDSYKGFLKFAGYNLINPNPVNRWTCVQLIGELERFQKTKYQWVKISNTNIHG